MEFQSQTLDLHHYYESTCSTPYVSAPSSPGRSHGPGPGPRPVFINSGFYYSAPASPMHFAMTQSAGSLMKASSSSSSTQPSSPDFEFSARFGSSGSGQTGSMTSADELFLNGKIRPMKLSTHLERPQVLVPLMDLEHEDDDEDNEVRGRDLRLRDNNIKSSSLRRRTRSMSPLRQVALNNINMCLDKDSSGNKPDTSSSSMSESSSRCSSAGRSSKKWVFLKDFLRSKSEGTGRSNNYKLWSTISFSQSAKAKKTSVKGNNNNNKPMNGIGKGKKRVPPSAHELLYTANRAQAEEMRKKTFLPYRQGLLGCLGFSSKSYTAMNGLARALNPVSSS